MVMEGPVFCDDLTSQNKARGQPLKSLSGWPLTLFSQAYGIRNNRTHLKKVMQSS